MDQTNAPRQDAPEVDAATYWFSLSGLPLSEAMLACAARGRHGWIADRTCSERGSSVAAGGSTKVVLAAMAASAGLAVATFAAGVYTGSSAMMAAGVQALIATSHQALLLIGGYRAQRSPDARDPIGQHQDLQFWAVVVAVLLFSLGAGVVLYDGVQSVMHPRPIYRPDVNCIILGIGLLLGGVFTVIALRACKRTRGDRPWWAAMRASKTPSLFIVVLEQLAAMAGLLIALVGVVVAQVGGLVIADGIASIAIGLILAWVAAVAAIEVRALLMAGVADAALQSGVIDVIGAEVGAGGVLAINEIRTMQWGATSVLVAVSIELADGMPAQDVEALYGRLDRTLRDRFPDVRQFFLEAQSADDNVRSLPTSGKSTAPLAASQAPGTAAGTHRRELMSDSQAELAGPGGGVAQSAPTQPPRLRTLPAKKRRKKRRR